MESGDTSGKAHQQQLPSDTSVSPTYSTPSRSHSNSAEQPPRLKGAAQLSREGNQEDAQEAHNGLVSEEEQHNSATRLPTLEAAASANDIEAIVVAVEEDEEEDREDDAPAERCPQPQTAATDSSGNGPVSPIRLPQPQANNNNNSNDNSSHKSMSGRIDDRPLLQSDATASNREQQPRAASPYGSTEHTPPPSLLVDTGTSVKYPSTVAIVNPLSGERSAAEFVYQCLCEELGASHVLKLNKELFQNPKPIQDLIQRHTVRTGRPDVDTRGTVVVSGGDGTVAFIMSQVDLLAERAGVDQIDVVSGGGATSPTNAGASCPLMPAVAVLALGTGNDFSNCMGFGNGYTKHKVCCMCVCCVNHVHLQLSAVVHAPAAKFDRWIATITPHGGSDRGGATQPKSGTVPREIIFMNYFSLGMDAFIATHFDRLRKRFPSCFQYRFQNKGWYGGLGIYGWAKCGRLNTSVEKISLLKSAALLNCRPPTASAAAQPATDNYITSVLPPKTKALILSNVNSYSGGTVLWHPTSRGSKYCVSPTPSSVYINDRMLEVQSVGGLVDMTMLQLHVGSGADKIAQTAECSMTVGAAASAKKPVPIQSDGEPMGFLTEPVNIHVKLYPKQIYVRCANASVVKKEKGR